MREESETQKLRQKPSLPSLASTQTKNQTQFYPEGKKKAIYFTAQGQIIIHYGKTSFHNCQLIATTFTSLVSLIKEISATHHF